MNIHDRNYLHAYARLYFNRTTSKLVATAMVLGVHFPFSTYTPVLLVHVRSCTPRTFLTTLCVKIQQSKVATRVGSKQDPIEIKSIEH